MDNNATFGQTANPKRIGPLNYIQASLVFSAALILASLFIPRFISDKSINNAPNVYGDNSNTNVVSDIETADDIVAPEGELVAGFPSEIIFFDEVLYTVNSSKKTPLNSGEYVFETEISVVEPAPSIFNRYTDALIMIGYGRLLGDVLVTKDGYKLEAERTETGNVLTITIKGIDETHSDLTFVYGPKQ